MVCFWLSQKHDSFESPKIIVPDYNNIASFTFDTLGHFYNDRVWYYFKRRYNIFVICAWLNQFAICVSISKINRHELRGGYVRFWTQFIEQLPIRTIDFSDPADKARHDRMVEMVEQMLALNKQLAVTNTAHEKTALQRQIDATDHQIDQLVYELYGLTDEEIKIVEG